MTTKILWGLAAALAACGTVKVEGAGGADAAPCEPGDDACADAAGGGEADGPELPAYSWIAVGSDGDLDLTGRSVKVGGWGTRVYYAVEGQPGGVMPQRMRSLDVNAGVALEEEAQRQNDLCGCGYDGQLTDGGDGLYYVANYAQVYTGSTWLSIDYPKTVQRGEAAAVNVDGHLWLMGGRGPLDTTVVLEPVFQQWTFGPNLPEATSSAAAVNVPDVGVLLFGGDTRPNAVWKYTAGSGESWDLGPSAIPGDGGRFASAHFVDGKVYLHAGGASPIRVYDPFEEMFEASIPPPEGAVGVTAVAGAVYAIVGQVGEIDVYRLDRP